MVLRSVAKLLIPIIALYAFYVQFHGDFGPGGGFQAGVIVAAGLILYGVVFGLTALRRVVPDAAIEAGAALGAARIPIDFRALIAAAERVRLSN